MASGLSNQPLLGIRTIESAITWHPDYRISHYLASTMSNQPLLGIQPLPGVPTVVSAVRAPIECGRAIHLESTDCVHFLQRLNASHELEGVKTCVVSTNVAFEGTLLYQDTRSMVEQSKVGIPRPAVNGALVLEYKDVFTGKRSIIVPV